MSLSVLALAGVVAASYLTRSSPAWDRSVALQEAPSAIAALASSSTVIEGVRVLIRNDEGEWMLLQENDSRLLNHHGLRYRIVVEDHGGQSLAVLQWAPGGRVRDDDDDIQAPRWSRIGSVILNRHAEP